MISLKDFIDENFNEFSNLGNSEVIECTLDDFTDEEITYLQHHCRFDYRGVCIYYVDRTNEIWIENMEA